MNVFCNSKYRISKHFKITKNKFCEIDMEWVNKGDTTSLFIFNSSLRTKTDHAGFEFFLLLGRAKLEFNIVDQRHWDHEKNTWA